MRRTAQIVEWNAEKGFGFTEAGGQRVMVHIGAFVERHKQPAVGDSISFDTAADSTGRTRAVGVTFLDRPASLHIPRVVCFVILLVAPGLAVGKLSEHVDPLIPIAWLVFASTITYLLYMLDKRRARTGAWRLSESIIHIAELLGGWPGAFLAQGFLRHKSSSPSFLVTFWIITIGYQLLAIDYMLDWMIAAIVGQLFGRFM